MMHYGKNMTGNERFFGFCIDILGRIGRMVGFDYIIDLVPDKKYGAKDPDTGEWNGMVLQLMKHVCIFVKRKKYDFLLLFLFCLHFQTKSKTLIILILLHTHTHSRPLRPSCVVFSM